MTISKPPDSLKPRGPGRKFWTSVLQEFVLSDPHHLQLLEQAAGCLDRISEAQQEVKDSGGFYQDRWGQPKEHPACKSERDSRILFARLLRELQLDATMTEESRPPQLYGVKKNA